GFIISDEEVKKADIYLQKNGINTSYEGALALAGLWKGKLQGLTFQKPICLLTGKKYD
ncbi:threonine synthase, partial [Candidatus Gottesmanbacteria bacterium]|nr:threonine synthase [Candidatus Gottesmanbacteria bacterium]